MDKQKVINAGSGAGFEAIGVQKAYVDYPIENKTGKIKQLNYILNGTSALKKRIKHETNRKEPFTSGTDAKDGSNVVVLMKTSFFEHVKKAFMKDLAVMDEVIEIGNASATKASSSLSGDAFVEYALDVRFRSSDHIHDVKLTAYATTCKLQVQH